MRWLNKDSKLFLERDYLLPNVTVEERIDQICEHSAKLLNKPEFKDKIKTLITNGWCSLASPIWANFGLERGLPISCFGSYIDDTMESILGTASEVGMMSKYGGGTSAYFGAVRERGAVIKNNGFSSGSAHFVKLYDTLTNICNQGSTRRGSFAAYQDISHADIEEWLDFKTEGNSVQDIFYGVCVSDEWMNSMLSGDKQKRKIWAKVIQRRSESGLPYIFFTDTINNNKPQIYKDKDYQIVASNLCTEIALPSNVNESFVCCVSSLNLLYYDEWVNTDAVETMIYFLDSVIQDFVNKAKKLPYMERSVKFAENHRALGLGVLGWHSLLQSKMIPFESFQAKMLNSFIFKNIQEKAQLASKQLAIEYEEAPILKGYGLRNTTLLAVAPTVSSSFILGQVSPSIEPLASNYYIKDLAKGKFSFRNPFLKKLLKEKNIDTDETWLSILKNNGSVQHLEQLTEHEKEVFKTFDEISQMEIIIQASQRQKFVDQAQSLNVKIHPNTSAKEINQLYIKAWELGVKTLYYQRSSNLAQELGKSILECTSCQA